MTFLENGLLFFIGFLSTTCLRNEKLLSKYELKKMRFSFLGILFYGGKILKKFLPHHLKKYQEQAYALFIPFLIFHLLKVVTKSELTLGYVLLGSFVGFSFLALRKSMVGKNQ